MSELIITRDDWLGTINSINSQDMARKALKYWDLFLKSRKVSEKGFIEDLKKIQKDTTFYQYLNLFVQYLGEQKLHPRTIRSYFSEFKQYLRSKGFRIYNEDIKQFVKFPRVLKETRVPLDHKTIQILIDKASDDMKLIILALLSSGMRASELLQLTKNDLTEPCVNLRAETTKTGSQRTTYFSKQVWDLLKNGAKRKGGYVFCSNYRPKKSLEELENKFSSIRDKCKLTKRYTTSNIHTVTLHRFRAFCKTWASEKVGKDFAEGLIGHEGYLSGYYGLSDEEKLKNYNKLEPYLTFKI